MPYSGIKPGSETESKLERCVSDVMSKQPDLSKSSAIAICRKSINASAQGGLALEPVTQADLSEYGNHALFAQAEGTMLKFKSAHLCSAGTNANGDWIDESGIKELAATMSFMPIDDEHIADKVIGFFVNPRTDDNSTKLITDGIIYNERFPDIVAQVQSGVKKLSVEAVAQKAICSVCEQEFTSSTGYCEHLKDKRKFGAQRKLYGLKAKGGATVFHPAWDTSFDANGFVMIASQVEFEPKEVKVETPGWVTDLTAKIESLVNRLKPVLEDGEMSGELAAVELICLALEAAKKKKWSKEVDLKEGSLSTLGWPNYNKLAQAVRSGKVSYATLIRKLAFLRNVTKDSATKSKAASFMERLKSTFRKDNKTEGGAKMSEINVDELNLEELGLVQASELETLKVDLEAKLAEKDTEAEKIKVGFARVLEMGLSADQLEILADMSEDAYKLLKSQSKEEVKVEAKEEKPEDKTEPLEGAVLEADDESDGALTWGRVGNILNVGGE